MGWIGWTERESLRTDVNSILMAMEGKLEMMYPGQTTPATPADKFRAFVAEHNDG